jgi:hypothetical protein
VYGGWYKDCYSIYEPKEESFMDSQKLQPASEMRNFKYTESELNKLIRKAAEEGDTCEIFDINRVSTDMIKLLRSLGYRVEKRFDGLWVSWSPIPED